MKNKTIIVHMIPGNHTKIAEYETHLPVLPEGSGFCIGDDDYWIHRTDLVIDQEKNQATLYFYVK